jgi:hypothetical protein
MAEEKKILKPMRKQTMKFGSFEVEGLGINEHWVPGEIVIISQDLFKLDLTSKEIEIIHKIITGLHFNNALWLFDHTTNTRNATAISSLRKRKIIFKTETKDIHLINPLHIRKGSPGQVLAHTLHELSKTSRVSRELVKPLKGKGRVSIDMFHMSLTN